MEREVLKSIYESRWLEWKKKIIDSDSTPVLLLSIGHGENIGNISISTCEEITDEDLEKLLIKAWRKLKTKKWRT